MTSQRNVWVTDRTLFCYIVLSYLGYKFICSGNIKPHYCLFLPVRYIQTVFDVTHPIDSLYAVESEKETVPVIERFLGGKKAR